MAMPVDQAEKAGDDYMPRISEDWHSVEQALADLNSAVLALKRDDDGVVSARRQAAPSLPPPSESPPSQSSPSQSKRERPLVEASPKKVHSVFASSNPKDLERCGRHYGLNIFAWSVHGGEGVLDDANSLQLRAASRLLARQKELSMRESQFGLEDVWRLQRQEMAEADLFLNAFHRNEMAPVAPAPSAFTDRERRAILEQIGRDISTQMRRI
mmetsp:Transcript_99661/g.157749  ORF Transcript_99661/g.157749 Transcript_99661/m.157749 type:complete len:213 (+) Transcript_99661:73-711(+)